MSALGRKLRRDLTASKGMIAAIVAIIAVGVGCFIGMFSLFRNLTAARADYYARCRMADFWIDLKKAPAADVERLARVRGVAEIRHRIQFPVVVDLPEEDRPIGGQVLTLPRRPNPHLNAVILRRGGYFNPRERDEVIVSEKFAAARGLAPGMFVHLILNGRRKKLRIVGTAISSEHIYLMPPGTITVAPGQYGLFFLPRDDAEDVFGFHGACNNVVGLLTPAARRTPQRVLDELAVALDEYGVFAATPLGQQTSHLTLSAELEQLRVNAVVLGAIFLGVAALVLNVLMTRLAEQQRTVVGTLKALGYSNGRVLLHFVRFAAVVGLLGGAAGIAVGYWLSGRMVAMYRGFFDFPRLVNDVYPGVMAMGVGVSVGFALLGALKGVRNVVKLSPAEAMRERPPARGGAILLERRRWLWRRLDFRWQMILRGLFRNRVRTLVALTAAAMGAALVLTAFAMRDSFLYMVDFEFGKVLRSDYDLALRDEAHTGAVDEARRMPGVVYAEGVLSVPCTFVKAHRRKQGAITGIRPGALLTVPRTTAGESIRVPRTGLLMTRRLAEQLGVGEGSTLHFRPIRGLRRTYEVPVVRAVDSTLGLAVYANADWLNRLVGETEAVSKVQVLAAQTPPERRAFLRHVKTLGRLQGFSQSAEQRRAVETELLSMMLGVMLVMVGFAAVIFFGSILNGSLISISERRREIATFRVLGYRPPEISGIFLRENLLVNLLGAVLGLPLGYALLNAMAKLSTNDLYAMPVKVQPLSWVGTWVLAGVFVLAAHWIVRRSIVRMDWLAALKVKE